MEPILRVLTAAALVIGLSFVAPTALLAEDDTETVEEQQTDLSEERLLEAASEITEQVVKIRGLQLKSSIPKGVKDRDQLRDMLVERFHDEVSEEQFQAEADVYRRLGLMDEGIDYKEMMLDLLTEQIAGFYDQHAGELYIMKGLPEALQRSTMAHELFHAIQDQHFDIVRLLEPFDPQENADYSLARMALIEGDATVLMFDYELYDQGHLPQAREESFIDIPRIAAAVLELDPMQMAAVEQLDQPDAMDLGGSTVPSLTDSALGTAPRIVRDTLLFPYIEGMRFVVRARSGRTWKEFDRVYDQPPVSTSQILHPEQYFDGVSPVDITYSADEALPDHRKVYDTVFGELKTRSWLATHLGEQSGELPEVAEISEGWRGDRLHGYSDGDGSMIVTYLSSWDSEDDAQTFARALDRTLRQRHDSSSAHRVGDHGESWCHRPGNSSDGQRHYIERWGEVVLYIEGVPSQLDARGHETDPTTYRLRDHIWDSHRRVPFDEVVDQRIKEVDDDSESSSQSDESASIPPAPPCDDGDIAARR